MLCLPRKTSRREEKKLQKPKKNIWTYELTTPSSSFTSKPLRFKPHVLVGSLLRHWGRFFSKTRWAQGPKTGASNKWCTFGVESAFKNSSQQMSTAGCSSASLQLNIHWMLSSSRQRSSMISSQVLVNYDWLWLSSLPEIWLQSSVPSRIWPHFPIVSPWFSSVPLAFLLDSSHRHAAGRRTAAVAQPFGASPEELWPHPAIWGQLMQKSMM